MTIVLCVDDSAVDRKLLGGTLENSVDFLVRYAESGREALEMIPDLFPHIIVTDLQMPDMNGLQLVEAVREQYPDLPVILSTAHGSEALAMDALKRGAASYVPKIEVAQKLKDTVEQVLGVAVADRRDERLVQFLEYDRQTFRLENDPSLIAPLVDGVQRTLKDMNVCPSTQRMHVGIALHEALLNALYHGNLEFSREEWIDQRQQCRSGELTDLVKERREQQALADRRIFVEIEVTLEHAEIVIRDEGPGFDLSTVPSPEDPSSLHRQAGQGLVLMENFMDVVDFSEQGNEVRMVMRPWPKKEKAIDGSVDIDTS